ncbi:hypothetical protein B0T10DRAFT_560741 [Thelonectria olida]|uniref:Uncharacterized protein n=1 Tax=Thelonectria olida TaxID=1576542 RepID=A0A9P8W7T7_9HYPO|nr:hypothetical protein B0T10DRAFT_560741 [Thelonectria olida]
MTAHDKDSPYTRMVWKPQFDRLDNQAAHPDIFASGSAVPHLHRLLDWTEDKLHRAFEDPASLASQIRDLTSVEREQRISTLAAELNPQSSESRLMCHLYNNLAAIYAGEKTGIQQGQVYRESNKRLGAMVALLAHQKPDLKILEVGAGTGSATREILLALAGSSPWRRYVEYRLTDTTTSFLASAEETFKDFGGLAYGAFDMEQPKSRVTRQNGTWWWPRMWYMPYDDL